MGQLQISTGGGNLYLSLQIVHRYVAAPRSRLHRKDLGKGDNIVKRE